jgi:hypothetical protein
MAPTFVFGRGALGEGAQASSGERTVRVLTIAVLIALVVSGIAVTMFR